MYNRYNCPWWLDKNFIIFILILLYYSSNNDNFKTPKENKLIPISSNLPKHTFTDENIDKKKENSSEFYNSNINIIKKILNSLNNSSPEKNTKSQNTEKPSDDNSRNTSSSSININNHLISSENINTFIDSLNSLKTSISSLDSKSHDLLNYTTHNECNNYKNLSDKPTNDSFSQSSNNNNNNNNNDSFHRKTNDCKPNHHNTCSISNNTQINNLNSPRKTILSKFPVVLSESVIEINIEADIIFEKPAIEIKRSKKDVILTEAKLLPFASNYNKDTGKFLNGKLFLKGFISNNIEYAAADCSDNKTTFNSYGNIHSGNIVHSTIEIPFDCVTEIKYLRGVKPIVNDKKNTKEVEIFNNCKLNCFKKCASANNSAKLCEKSYEDKIQYNNDFKIQLQDIRILEIATEKHSFINHHNDKRKSSDSTSHHHLFKKITENLVLVVKLKVLQNQQVNVELLEL